MNPLIQTPSPIKKVLIIGAECTGKTTLCQDLAQALNTVWVGEYMRTYLEDKPLGYVCQYDDLLPIAIGQIATENAKATLAKEYLFCDTSLFEIMAYAFWYFGKCPDAIIQAVKACHYDLALLTDEIGITWQADGMRDLPHGRADMRAFFVDKLAEFGIGFSAISGSRRERVAQVLAMLTDGV